MLTPAPRVLPELEEGHGAILGVRCLSISLRVQQVTPDGIVAVLVGEGAVEDVYFCAVRMVVRPKDALELGSQSSSPVSMTTRSLRFGLIGINGIRNRPQWIWPLFCRGGLLDWPDAATEEDDENCADADDDERQRRFGANPKGRATDNERRDE